MQNLNFIIPNATYIPMHLNISDAFKTNIYVHIDRSSQTMAVFKVKEGLRENHHVHNQIIKWLKIPS